MNFDPMLFACARDAIGMRARIVLPAEINYKSNYNTEMSFNLGCLTQGELTLVLIDCSDTFQLGLKVKRVSVGISLPLAT